MKLSRNVGTASEDLSVQSIERVTALNRKIFLMKATTRVSEDPNFQQELPNIYVLYESIPHEVELSSGEVFKKFVWITIVDSKDISDLSQFVRVHNEQDRLITLHTSEWKAFWDENSITVDGNDELSKSIQSSLYAIASSLPSLNNFRAREPFFGLSPSGLGLGGPKLEGYQGHNFWDTETWMHPPILLLEPKWSEKLLNYRYMLRQTARENAQNTSYKGLRQVEKY